MHECVLQVRLTSERHAQPRRVRGIWKQFIAGSIVQVENNRQRERGNVDWMNCRVTSVSGDELTVRPLWR